MAAFHNVLYSWVMQMAVFANEHCLKSSNCYCKEHRVCVVQEDHAAISDFVLKTLIRIIVITREDSLNGKKIQISLKGKLVFCNNGKCVLFFTDTALE